ncbi:Cytoplasmic dynein 2 light intermediate chain 1 [Trichostrongylus colubriformis]|uniref:Cytoplasmic dynein 2 light intermediate chain 1 n=1 Tax=Trichostrongylus colubriformis TaxID=6319 RepID=A0AAN8GD01_TRICO
MRFHGNKRCVPISFALAMDIWSLAEEKLRENEEKSTKLGEHKNEQKGEGTHSRKSTHIILCGNSQSGKSTMVNKFLDRKEEAKETIALEYIYARRTRGNNKDICHIWELGGGTELLQLLAIPLVKENIETGSSIMVVDLTHPYELWITVERLISDLSRYAEAAIRNLDERGQSAIRSRMNYRVSEYKDDLKMCSPFPIPLLIVGTKYDEFQNFDSEQRRKICCTLRFLAHYYGAHLVFYSCFNEQLVKVGRGLFSHLAFDTSISKGKVDDHNRPLYIVSGTDSFESIGPPPIDSASFSRAGQPINLWKNAFCEHFEQKDRETGDKSSEEQQLFLEPMIDNTVAQREKDLEIYIKQRKDRQAAETRAAQKPTFL